jgi:hypothetical protein
MINDQNKTEHKTIGTEIDDLKTHLLSHQSTLGTQSSKLSILEKEVSIFKTPNTINNSLNSNLETIELKGKPLSKRNSEYKSEDMMNSLTISDPNDVNSFNSLGGKLEENINFLISVKTKYIIVNI